MTNPKIEQHTLALPSGHFPSSLIKTEKSKGKLAVVLPGAGYSCKMPLLYFSVQVLLNKGFDVITIDKMYADDPKWRELTTMESALKVVEDDSHELFDQIPKKLGSEIHTVLGRSLGTYTMACALKKGKFRPRQLVWQTPSLNDNWEVIKNCGIKGFGIIGTADQRYDIAKPYMPETSLIVENADHGMEIPGDPVRSVGTLQQVIKATDEWVQI